MWQVDVCCLLTYIWCSFVFVHVISFSTWWRRISWWQLYCSTDRPPSSHPTMKPWPISKAKRDEICCSITSVCPSWFVTVTFIRHLRVKHFTLNWFIEHQLQSSNYYEFIEWLFFNDLTRTLALLFFRTKLINAVVRLPKRFDWYNLVILPFLVCIVIEGENNLTACHRCCCCFIHWKRQSIVWLALKKFLFLLDLSLCRY